MSKKDKKKNKKKLNDNSTEVVFHNDVYIHHVYEGNKETDALWSHSHGMENYGLKNITMYAPNVSWAEFDEKLLRLVCEMMIDGVKLDTHRVQIFDKYEGGPLIHAFLLEDSEEYDEYTGERNLEIFYPFEGLEGPIPWNGKNYIFNDFAREWVSIEELMECYFHKESQNE